MIKEIRKVQEVEIIKGVVANSAKKPNSTNYFDYNHKHFNYNLMRTTDKLCCVAGHAFESHAVPRRSENRFM